MPQSPADLGALQRTAGNRAVQRLVAGALTVQRQPTPPPPAGAEKAPVKGTGPVGGAGRPLPAGSKVETKPPPPVPAPGPEKEKEEEKEKAVEFHAEVSGSATVVRSGDEPAQGKGAGAVEAGLELPKFNLWESKPGKPGAPRWKLLTNPEFHVEFGGEIEKGKVSPALRAEVGIDLVRLTWEPWAFRLVAAGGELALGEGPTAKVGAGVEKELPKTGGFGFKGEAAAGFGKEGPSGEARARLLYAPQQKDRPVQLYLFGELKGTVAKDESKVQAAGTGTFGIGGKF